MKTILVPTDFSTYGLHATQTAASMAEKTHAKIILQHNVPTLLRWSGMTIEQHRNYPDIMQESLSSESRLGELMDNYHLRHLDVSRVVTQGVTHEKIIEEAYQEGVDIIVIGSHGNEKHDRCFIGSNIQKVMREAHCPVMTIRKETHSRSWKRAVVPVSLDEDISVPFSRIKEIAMGLGSTVHLLFVNSPAHFKNEHEIRSRLISFAREHPEIEFETAIYNNRDIDTGILEYAHDVKADWIGMVAHNRKHKDKYLIGITETIAFKSDLPLLTVLLN